ncbi:MAG: hypothetical protein KF849_07475 [Rhizobiaceae bacterium]|nr:hypothetical protein [Rhizobiaceae bacterium]
MSTKLRVARSQLGTALALFIRDYDPISVQALACGGSEIVEGLAQHAKLPTLSSHILQVFPDVDLKKVKALRNQYWNAIKNFYKMDGVSVRDDEALFSSFKDESNDAVLFMGWLDYLNLTRRLPVEVQVFQVWWYATNEERLAPGVDPTPFRSLFPRIASMDRFEQKRRLRRACEKYRDNREILSDPRTEVGPLVPRA